MKCRGCGYSLWTIPPGPCPECGRQFALDEFQFVRGAVHFACPQCEQKYQGNGADGLPAPREFTCARCSAAVRVADMRATPAPGHDPDACEAFVHPWLDRGERSIPVSLGRTMWATISAPGPTQMALRGRPSLRAAALYALLVALLALIPAGLLAVVLSMLPTAGGIPSLVSSWESSVVGACIGVLVAGASLALWTVFVHSHLWWHAFGKGHASVPLRVTAAVMLWSTTPLMLAIASVPILSCFGPVAAVVWMALIAARALSVAHGVGMGRAVLATAAPLVLVTILGCVGFVGLSVALVSQIPTMRNPPPPAAVAPAPPEIAAPPLDADQFPAPEPEPTPEGDAANDQFGAEPDPNAGEPKPE